MILSDDILGRRPDSWWKFLFGAIGLPLIYFIALIIFGVIYGFMASAGWVSIDVMLEINDPKGPSSPLPLIVMFMIIGVFHLFLALFIRWFYGRKYMSVIDPFHQGWRQGAITGLGLMLATLILSEILSFVMSFGEVEVDYVWKIKTWLIWIIPMALAVFLQSSAEEVFFRGFMQQYLRRLIPKRWAYMFIPSLYWSLLHIGNFEGFWLSLSVVFSLLIMGLIFADWAERTGSLYGPIFAHFGNNIFLTVIYGNDLEPSDLQIWQAQIDGMTDQSLGAITILNTLCLVVIYWLFLRYKLMRKVKAL